MSQRIHLRAIDGLRGLAIIAVVAYHLDFGWADGGFLGVDLFFVISGYVITRLLRFEMESTKTIALARFYAARAFRLVPAILTLVVALAIIAPLIAPDAAQNFIATVPFTLTGSSNWYFIAISSNYFVNQGRSLLQHTWSLSVEAQYYLLWPLVMLTLRKRAKASLLWSMLTASALALGTTYIVASATPASDLGSFLYFGTPTHLPSLLVGSALGLVWGPEYLSGQISTPVRRTIDGIGIGALLGLIAMFGFPFGQATPLLTAAFPVVALLSGLLIAVLTHPRSKLGWLFTGPVMMWLGTRSYSLYLWHWPIFQLLRPGLEIVSPNVTTFVRLALLICASEASYRFIEEPWRRRRSLPYFQKSQLRLAERRQQLSLIASLSVGTVAVTGLVVANLATAATPTDATEHNAPRTVSVVKAPAAGEQPLKFWAVGDSVLIDVKAELEKELTVTQFDGEVGRQATGVLAAIQNVWPISADNGVILNIGNNGYIGDSTLESILSLLSRQKRVVVINASVPRRWQTPNNELISRVALNFPNVRIADWRTASEGHPDYFLGDGVHLSQDGVTALVDCIIGAVRAK